MNYNILQINRSVTKKNGCYNGIVTERHANSKRRLSFYNLVFVQQKLFYSY